jgi:hypothetical protein
MIVRKWNGGQRPPRKPMPGAAERADRRNAQAEDGKLAWREYQEKIRAIDANTSRLRALRLEREAASKKN